MNLDTICEQIKNISLTVGEYIRKEKENFNTVNKEKKGLHNFVTHVDMESEKRIINQLNKIIPGAGFLAEEGTNTKMADEYNWVIDPLDGTTNFIHGMPPYAISIALHKTDEPIIGVIYEIGLDECFYAHTESKAYLNGKEIKVSNTDRVFDSLIATGFPYTDFSKMDRFFKSMDYFMRNSHGLRRLGSAATDLAYVACGRCDAFYEYGLNPWDVSAGSIIIKQAGGKLSGFNKHKNYIFDKEIIACNYNIFDEFYRIINKIMVK